MTPELRAGTAFEPELYQELTRRAVLECFKWNLSTGDQPTLCRYPLLLSPNLWCHLRSSAETLAEEALAAERELVDRPQLQVRLGFSRGTAEALRRAKWSEGPRYTRFDFHPTTKGFRITESNCDVAGGLLESSGVGGVLSELLGRGQLGDPAGALADEFVRRLGRGARIGLCHLASYTEDRQVVLYLARRFEERDLEPVLFDASQLRRGLYAQTPTGKVELNGLYRFFPGDWLEQLPSETGWRDVFSSECVSNPLTTLLIQSKRFPLVWAELRAKLPAWRALLPRTVAPAQARGRESRWVIKPAFGHEGADIALPGVTPGTAVAARRRAARRAPRRWVAQERFGLQPLQTPDGARFVCVGVFVVGLSAAGAYARVSETPLIDARAQEAVVFVEES